MFQKYPSIEGFHNQKSINHWLGLYPELAYVDYLIAEKLHGANFQRKFWTDGSFRYGSRNNPLVDENFYGYKGIVERPEYVEFFERVKEFIRQRHVEVTLYGELFGGNVQKGVDYGKEKRIKFFDIRINDGTVDHLLSQYAFREFMGWMNAEDLIVRHYTIVHSLEEALAFDTMIPTEEFDGGPENHIEGVVIKPYHKVYTSPVGNTFYIKKVNQAFKEKQSGHKVKVKVPAEIDHEVVELHEEFLGYINSMRVEKMFSKEGPMESMSQMGHYIKLVLEDAREDFFKDGFQERVEALEKKDVKLVFNVGSVISKMLQRAMEA